MLQVQTAATLLGVLGDTSTHRVEGGGWRVEGVVVGTLQEDTGCVIEMQ